jgi:hypothetical protein
VQVFSTPAHAPSLRCSIYDSLLDLIDTIHRVSSLASDSNDLLGSLSTTTTRPMIYTKPGVVQNFCLSFLRKLEKGANEIAERPSTREQGGWGRRMMRTSEPEEAILAFRLMGGFTVTTHCRKLIACMEGMTLYLRSQQYLYVYNYYEGLFNIASKHQGRHRES